MIEGPTAELSGRVTSGAGAGDLWMDTDHGLVRINLDVYGHRRRLACDLLLAAGDHNADARAFGVLSADGLLIERAFHDQDQREHSGYIELVSPLAEVHLSATMDRPDRLAGWLDPLRPAGAAQLVPAFRSANLPRLLALYKYLGGRTYGRRIRFTAGGRLSDDGRSMRTDFIGLELPDDSALVRVEGEIVPSRHGLHLVSRSGQRVRLRVERHLPGHLREWGRPSLDRNLIHSHAHLTGIIRRDSPSILRVFLIRE